MAIATNYDKYFKGLVNNTCTVWDNAPKIVGEFLHKNPDDIIQCDNAIVERHYSCIRTTTHNLYKPHHESLRII